LPRYYALVQRLRQDGVEWVSSERLGRALGLTSSTVRQDLSHLDFSGISRRGYSTAGLDRALSAVLGADQQVRMVIVGAGNLGKALARHAEFAAKGFALRGIFDRDPRVVGSRVGGLPVLGMERLADVVRAEQAEVGIIAVPASAAQEVADRLVRAGIRGLLNLADAHVLAPADVPVVDARILASLQELVYQIRTKSSAGVP